MGAKGSGRTLPFEHTRKRLGNIVYPYWRKLGSGTHKRKHRQPAQHRCKLSEKIVARTKNDRGPEHIDGK